GRGFRREGQTRHDGAHRRRRRSQEQADVVPFRRERRRGEAIQKSGDVGDRGHALIIVKQSAVAVRRRTSYTARLNLPYCFRSGTMRRLRVLLCALLFGLTGCASDGSKGQWDEFWKDVRGDNMKMRGDFSALK